VWVSENAVVESRAYATRQRAIKCRSGVDVDHSCVQDEQLVTRVGVTYARICHWDTHNSRLVHPSTFHPFKPHKPTTSVCIATTTTHEGTDTQHKQVNAGCGLESLLFFCPCLLRLAERLTHTRPQRTAHVPGRGPPSTVCCVAKMFRTYRLFSQVNLFEAKAKLVTA